MGNVERRRRTVQSATEYTVGYRNPPLHSRWKPGQSGFPSGRPKGRRNFKTVVLSVLKSLVQVTRNGKLRKISTQEALVLRLLEKGLKGADIRALERLIQLAQHYDSDERTDETPDLDEDRKILEIYNQRVLSGAISKSRRS
jgi:hypothetical protein